METNTTTTHTFSSNLLAWYDKFGRKDLPWQQAITPYRVWLSEVMLQQTQVKTVIPYFNQFTNHFPTLDDLANATLDEVLHLWTGLGYYSRARNLYKTAQLLATQYNSEFPSSVDELCKLPGIGRSTAGAICAIAFQSPTPILDGNVKRVLCRFLGITEYPNTTKTQKMLWIHAKNLTPTQRVRDYTQAIMDLGATLCTRTKPNCDTCPLHKTCYAKQHNLTDQLPRKRIKTTLPEKTSQFLLILNADHHVLLEKRPPIGVWGGLWSFPECQQAEPVDFCQNKLKATCTFLTSWPNFQHTFSHFHLIIQPQLMLLKSQPGQVMDSQDYLWYDHKNPQNIGLAAPVKQLLQRLSTYIESNQNEKHYESNCIVS